jgi:DNA excision repair protein ERCC-2
MPPPPELAGEPASEAWTYTVSVRELCEFTAKRADLDRRFTPSATALEGQQGQNTWWRSGAGRLRDRDCAGGHLRPAARARPRRRPRPARRCLEEIKTIRGHPDEIPANRRLLHWAQLQTYGALFCRAARPAGTGTGAGVR